MLHLSPCTGILNENPLVNNIIMNEAAVGMMWRIYADWEECYEAAMPLPGNKLTIICINSGQY